MDYVQHGGNGQKAQWNNGVADGPQIAGKEVIQENGGNAQEDHKQVSPHIAPHRRGNSKKGTKPIQADKGQTVQSYRHKCNKEKRGTQIFPQSPFVPLAEAHGKQGASEM